MNKINQINLVLQEYFDHNKSATKILAKDMMVYFILAGIFKKDNQNGMPIKRFLSNLQKQQQIHLIPFAFAEQKNKYVRWYFMKVKYKAPLNTIKLKSKNPPKSISHLKLVENFKEICDVILGSKGKKNYVFETKFSFKVDLYYPKLNLVIGCVSNHLNENESNEKVKSLKPQKISGKLQDFLTQKGIRWVEIPHFILDENSSQEAIQNQIENIKNHLNALVLL